MRAKQTIQVTGLGPEPFLNRHAVLFFFWAVGHRIQWLRKQQAAAPVEALSVRMADLREAWAA